MNILWSLLALTVGASSPAGAQPAPTNVNPITTAVESAWNLSALTAQKNSVVIDADNPPAKIDPQPDAPKVKGVYVTAYSAGGSRLNQLLDLLDNTGLNSMVIDIKDDLGYITYKTENQDLLKMGTSQKFIPNIKDLMGKLQKHNVYPIARIVVFKDTVLAEKHPELSFTNADGSVWKNGGGDAFVNPYSKKVWDYNVEIAKEAAALGFKEIQFDYVRFAEGFEKRADTLKYEKMDGKSRTEAVAEFVQYARKELAPLGVRVSVDIFGYAASVPAADGIGQDFTKISENVDVIAPMVYPSHYSGGWFGAKDPDKEPYKTIKGSMVDTFKKLDEIKDKSQRPIVRPWIQDFTASWLGSGHYTKYGKAEVDAQIKAMADMGVDEYLLWNASNRYTSNGNYGPKD